MAKQQTKDATKASNDLIGQSKRDNSALQGSIQQDQAGSRTRRDDTYGAAYGGFQDQQKTGGFDEGRVGRLRGQVDDLSASGGYDPARTSSGMGGFNSEALGDLRNRGQTLMDTGGYDSGSADKIRGGYGGFIDNGGYNEQDRSNYLNSATSGVTNTYGVLQNQLKNQQAASGGYSAGGASGQMARQLAQAQSQSTLDANTSLNQQVNANKLSGLSGLGGFEGNVAGARRDAFGQVTGLENDVAAGNRMQEGDVASGRRAGTQMGIGLEGQIASGRNSANQGMMQMFMDQSGAVSDQAKQMLTSMGLDASTQESAIASLTRLSQNPGAFQTALNNIVGLSGAAAGVMGAWPKPKPTPGGGIVP